MEISAPDTARQPMEPGTRYPREVHSSWTKNIAKWIVKLPNPLHEATNLAAAAVNKLLFRPNEKAGVDIPRQQDSWTFAAIGDYGVGKGSQARVAANILDSDHEFVLTLGDNVYEGGAEHEYRKFYDPPQYFGKLREKFDIYPALGNHDIYARRDAKPYFDRYPDLDGARYYTFAKNNVRFVVTDSNETMKPGSVQHEWVNSVLSDAKEGWKVLITHHPLKSALDRAKNANRYEHLAPLLARHGVDLVLAGHDHAYERTRPLNEHGTIQVTAGTGGRHLYPYMQAQPERGAYRNVGFGHVEFEVTQDALIGRYILGRGKVGDTFKLEKQSMDGVSEALSS